MRLLSLYPRHTLNSWRSNVKKVEALPHPHGVWYDGKVHRGESAQAVTPLKSIDGKTIWEGDRVRHKWTKNEGVVRYVFGDFLIVNDDGDFLKIDEEYEIVGTTNVHSPMWKLPWLIESDSSVLLGYPYTEGRALVYNKGWYIVYPVEMHPPLLLDKDGNICWEWSWIRDEENREALLVWSDGCCLMNEDGDIINRRTSFADSRWQNIGHIVGDVSELCRVAKQVFAHQLHLCKLEIQNFIFGCSMRELKQKLGIK